MTIRSVEVRDSADFKRVFAAIGRDRPDARALGLAIPKPLLLQADRVIE